MLDYNKFLSALHVMYPQKRIQHTFNKEQPLWAWIKKRTDWKGRYAEIPIQTTLPGGGSADFGAAQANKASSEYTHFLITLKRLYQMISVDRETMEASASNPGAYMEAKASEVENVFTALAIQTGADLVGNGGGAIAKGTALTGNVYTVREQDIARFKFGMQIQTATTDGTSGSVRTGVPGYATVTAIDFDNNKITVDDIAQITGAASTDYIFPRGNFGQAMTGILGWLPSDRSILGTPFKNVTRSAHPSKLAGIYYDASSYGLLEGCERAYARARKEGASPGRLWVNYRRFADFSLELGAKLVREQVKSGAWGYDVIKFHAAGKVVEIAADPNLADDEGLALDRDSWEFHGLKEAPRFLMFGNKQLVESTADAVELRMGWSGELACAAPGANMRIKLPT